MSVRDYRVWEEISVTVGSESYVVATKPGVPGHRTPDAAAALLGQHVNIGDGNVVVYMNTGNGLAPLIGARAGRGSKIYATDRNILSVEAARWTLRGESPSRVVVIAAQGAKGIDDVHADIVAIRIPQEKMALVQLLFDAFRILEIGGTCYIAGANNEGIKPASKTIERIFGNSTLLAYESGNRIFSASKTSDLPADSEVFESPYLPADSFREIDATLRGNDLKIFSRPGVFSWDHVDEATQILADHIDIQAHASVLDLGCGSGPLGVVAAMLGAGQVTFVDADVEAVRSATKTAQHAGLKNFRAMPSDVASAVLDERFDAVVTNPPFHVGKQTELSVPMQFIEESYEVLSPGGRLFLVANRTLPYETPIKHRFGNVSMIHDGRRFKVLGATR
jgi:16S rRNA (guanine1207-N2)-methyltransferase